MVYLFEDPTVRMLSMESNDFMLRMESEWTFISTVLRAWSSNCCSPETPSSVRDLMPERLADCRNRSRGSTAPPLMSMSSTCRTIQPCIDLIATEMLCFLQMHHGIEMIAIQHQHSHKQEDNSYLSYNGHSFYFVI